VLAVAALAAQGFADVELPTGQRRPLSLFLVSVATSGDRKSSSDSMAMEAVFQREEELGLEFKKLDQKFRWERAAYEKAAQNALTESDGDLGKASVAAKELPNEPHPPLTPVLVVPEPTLEGLYRLLLEGQPSIGLFTDEGGQFIGGHSMATDLRMRTASGLSSLWDGTPTKAIRKGHPPIILAHKRLSMHLMAQPSVAKKLLSDPMLKDQGLLSRCLVVEPESVAGTRFWRETDPADAAALTAFTDHMLKLLRRSLPLKSGSQNELAPRLIKLSAEARANCIAFINYIETEIAPGGTLDAIAPLANKATEHAIRIAGVMTVVVNPDALEIDADTMARGIAIATFYLEEALRLAEDDEHQSLEALAEKTWKSILKLEERKSKQAKPLPGDAPIGIVTLRNVYSSGPSKIRKREHRHLAKQVMTLLESRGLLEKRANEPDRWTVKSA